MTDASLESIEPEVTPTQPGFARMTRVSVVFAIGAIAGKVITLILLPVLTRFLTPAEFGIMDVLLSLGGALAAIALLGLDVAALRMYFDQPDSAARRRLFGTWYAIGLGVTLAIAFAIAVSAGAISAYLSPASNVEPAVLAVAVIVVAQPIQVIVLTVLRARGRAGWYASINVGVLLIYAALAVLLLSLWQANANAVLVAWAVALSLSAVGGTLLVRHDVLGRPAITAGRSLLRLGLPLAPAIAADWVSEFLVRTILLGTSSAGDVAYFTVAARFASVARLAVAAFELAWQPRAYSLGTSGPARVRLAADAHLIVAIVCGVVLAEAAFAPEIVEIAAGSGYSASLPALGFSLVTILARALYLGMSLPSAIDRKMQDLAIATGASAVTAVIGTLVLAPFWHSAGTAAAVAASQFVAVLIVGRRGLRRLHLPIDWARLGALVTFTGVIVLTLLISGSVLPVRLLVGSVALIVIGSFLPLRDVLNGLRARYRR